MKRKKNTETQQLPHPLVAVLPIVTLMLLIALMVKLFGADALSGGSQVALLLSAGLTLLLSSVLYHMPWSTFTTALQQTIGNTSEPIFILLIIGMLGGTWMISGAVPTLICYGVQVMSPRFFLVTSCLICAVISVLTGSSWSTIATIGVALIGIGTVLGVSPAWSAGAIISGAYFGDKVSPLSDTTILASSTSGTELFTHIRYMLRTTIPSFTIALIVFLMVGLLTDTTGAIDVDTYVNGLKSTFHISPLTLIVPVLTAVMIALRIPSLVTLFVSSLAGGVAAIILQPQLLVEITGNGDGSFMTLLQGMLMTLFTSTSVQTGNALLDDLVATGGMAGMLDTVWLIMCALFFGSTMVASRMLQSITLMLIRLVRRTVGLVSSTVTTGLVMNICSGDQYMSIILTTSMFKDVYRDKGYEPRLLSRTAEDAVTVTSVLIPWNTCGMTQSTVLGVPTVVYLPCCVFNYLSPLMSILVAAIGWGIRKREK